MTEYKVATASEDGAVTVWSTLSCEQVLKVQTRSSCWNVCFSRDGHLMATSGRDAVELWDFDKASTVFSTKSQTGEIYGLSFSPLGQQFASG